MKSPTVHPTLARHWAGLLAFLLLWGGTAAFGHDPMASYAIGRLKGETLELQIKIAADSAWPLVQDTVAPGAIFVREDFDTVGRGQLLAFAKLMETMTVADQPVPPRRLDVAVVDDNFLFTLVYPRPSRGPLRLTENYLRQMSSDYVSNLTILDEADKPVASQILTPTDNSFVMTSLAAGAAPRGPTPTFGEFLRLGIEHILTGYDHLLFLGGLLVVCRRWSTMLGIITCFTLAHSLTLALSALDVISLPSRIVEPLIAASIVFVGVENVLRREEPRGRWALTFGFGLIHGFGFASVLKEIGLGSGGASILLPLFSFNLGVELGQVLVTVVVLPFLLLLRRRSTMSLVLRPAVSIVVALMGGYWLLMRTVFS